MKFKVILLLLVLSLSVNALQIRLIDNAPDSSHVKITNPEELHYFFGELNGEPEYYTIIAEEPFTLSTRLLVPDVPGDKKQLMSLYISTEGRMPIFEKEPTPFEREQYYDQATGAWYILDAGTDKDLEAGNYVIRVYNEGNAGKYTLSVGIVDDPSFVQKIIWTPFLLAAKDKYLGGDLVVPALNKIFIIIILVSLSVFYVSLLVSRKTKDYKSVVEGFFYLRYILWGAIILSLLAGFALYNEHPGNPLLIGQIVVSVILAVYCGWLTALDMGTKFSKIRDKKVLITEKYNRFLSERLLVAIGLWTIVMMMASVF